MKLLSERSGQGKCFTSFYSGNWGTPTQSSVLHVPRWEPVQLGKMQVRGRPVGVSRCQNWATSQGFAGSQGGFRPRLGRSREALPATGVTPAGGCHLPTLSDSTLCPIGHSNRERQGRTGENSDPQAAMTLPAAVPWLGNKDVFFH